MLGMFNDVLIILWSLDKQKKESIFFSVFYNEEENIKNKMQIVLNRKKKSEENQ